MKNDKMIHVATFGKPQGLRGEIKINIHTENLDSFKYLKEYWMEESITKIIFKSIRKIGKKYTSFIENCNDRNTAESYKGKKVFTFRNNFPITNEDEYYVSDLIGCKVINNEKKNLGMIVDIKNFGAGDLMEINRENSKIFFIPMNNENLISVDLKNKIIIADPISGLID